MCEKSVKRKKERSVVVRKGRRGATQNKEPGVRLVFGCDATGGEPAGGIILISAVKIEMLR